QCAVEPAAVRDGVDVAADEHGLVGGAAQREPLVPRGIDPLLRPGLCNLAPQPLACPFPGVGPRDALGAVLVAGQLLELAQLGAGAAGVERHAATLTFRAASVVSIARCRRSRSNRRREGS